MIWGPHEEHLGTRIKNIFVYYFFVFNDRGVEHNCNDQAMMLDNFKDRGVEHNCGARQFQHMPDPANYPAHYNWTDGITEGSVAVAFKETCYAQCYPGRKALGLE